MLQKLRDPSYKPVGLFADFYFLLWKKSGREFIPPEHIAPIYDSLVAKETENCYARISLEGEDYDEVSSTEFTTVTCELELLTSQSESVLLYEFPTTVKGDASIYFERYLRDADINLPCEVTLGRGGGDLEIGPAVQIRCRRLRIYADRLTIGGKTRHRGEENINDSVVLESELCESSVHSRPSAYVPFHVFWKGAETYPWTDYLLATLPGLMSDAALWGIYRRFRRIVSTLRSHSRGALGRVVDKVESERVTRGDIGKALLKQLLEDRILYREGRFYYWDPESANRHVSISWQKLKNGECSEKLREYLQEFLKRQS